MNAGRDSLRHPRADEFLWSAGIEDTFITAPGGPLNRILDEYELIDHYRRCESDLDLMRGLGVRTARYGIPWYRLNPAPGRWDWEWVDRPIEHMLEIGIRPILELVHYGVPSWIEGAFLNPDFASHLAEYAARLAERYRGRVTAFTPLNEPRITAWYSGRLGWWPPYGRSQRQFARILVAIVSAIADATRALRSDAPDAVIVHCDGADLYGSDDPSLADRVRHSQELVFLPLDLLFGRVGPRHSLWDWLTAMGVAPQEIERLGESPQPPDVVGLNAYPMFSSKVYERSGDRIRLRNRVAPRGVIEQGTRLHWERFGKPMMITETAGRGSVRRRLEWLEQSVREVRGLRAEGIPLIGYTWWPMISHIAWAYRQGRKDAGAYVEHMGLWDLEPEADYARKPTALVDAYRALVTGGASAVGSVAAQSG
ncbi:MAG: beta-glucosidase [Sphingomonadales bacterium]|jgi:beta-glucosidase/6-phospho-beta-glucosidase/beta-galactosidase|nr:beta-glucosidase [Sphingomonadales bacterium]